MSPRERFTDARDAAAERMTDAREAASERFADAKAAMAEAASASSRSPTPRRGGREGRRREGGRRRADREGEAAASRRLARVRLPRLAGPRRRADRAREGSRGTARGRDLRGQPLGAVRRQRPLPRPRLAAAERAAVDAATRPHDDLLPDRRNRDPVRDPRHGAAAVDRAADRGLDRRPRRHRRRARLDVVAEVGLGGHLHRRRPDRRGRVPGDHRRDRDRRRHPDRAAAARSTRPAPWSTRPSARTRARRCSDTTRSSTCS